MPNFSKPLGDAVHRARTSLGLTQAQAADRANVDPRTVLNIENYKGNPKLAVLFPLVRALHMDPNEFFYPESATDRTNVQQLHIMIESCSDQEAAALIPIIDDIIKALRNQDHMDV